jgi:hypothetical protein
MKTKRFGWMSRTAVALVGGLSCAACFSIQATDGNTFSGRYGAILDAVHASAASDTGCQPGLVDVRDTSAANSDRTYDFVAAGCGWQVTYQVQPAPGANQYRVVKVLAIPPATAPAGVACAKDTDCKGDRVCDRGKCSAPQPNERQPSPLPTAQ